MVVHVRVFLSPLLFQDVPVTPEMWMQEVYNMHNACSRAPRVILSANCSMAGDVKLNILLIWLQLEVQMKCIENICCFDQVCCISRFKSCCDIGLDGAIHSALERESRHTCQNSTFRISSKDFVFPAFFKLFFICKRNKMLDSSAMQLKQFFVTLQKLKHNFSFNIVSTKLKHVLNYQVSLNPCLTAVILTCGFTHVI